MKKLITLIALMTTVSAYAAGEDYSHYEEANFEVSQENLDALEDFAAESENKMMGGWECEARSFDGGIGIGRGYARAQAANFALGFCRQHTFNPMSCRIISCFPL